MKELSWFIFFGMFVILACLADLAHGSDDFTSEDMQVEIAWQVLNVMDTITTLEIARHPDKYYEMNPILGRHPTQGKVFTYMLASAFAHYFVRKYLPREIEIGGYIFEPRKTAQAISIGITGSFVTNNINIGLGFNW